jgi:hypothetical protein
MTRRYCIDCDERDEALRNAIKTAERRRNRHATVDLDAMTAAKARRDQHRKGCHVYQTRNAA